MLAAPTLTHDRPIRGPFRVRRWNLSKGNVYGAERRLNTANTVFAGWNPLSTCDYSPTPRAQSTLSGQGSRLTLVDLPAVLPRFLIAHFASEGYLGFPNPTIPGHP
jgi:hypothetical protein